MAILDGKLYMKMLSLRSVAREIPGTRNLVCNCDAQEIVVMSSESTVSL